MGSLLSGWDSPTSDPSSVILKRNRSLTKEEIEAFWRSKRKTEEEHLNAIYGSPDSCNQQYGREYMRSSSMPIPNRNQGFIDMDTEKSLENIVKQSGWWTRSTWAFLNEPPVLDRPTNNYQPQFHVASLATSKFNKNSGISAN
ncbi:hypothetical protein E1A91_D01G129200v1 [Gossypium mustelinum]|uniref:Uncharacterized protein n=3 Tax=Gossypium TaxID=3633 RepID=A0A5J5SPU5_GOSBA|nr:hypothetical protein ES319_D01G124600v1 [Gossypium barbadense]PPD93830.1 hypothetical protein GOBAR_DD09136 [Gossypium barbadense]TYG83004.1 hypothetical protein ES288_D01G134200v1 [Gossypium darwinii]TYI97232.1 hypothetical protein E1A91_D01G129200v1 [Gossypium mustelinum]